MTNIGNILKLRQLYVILIEIMLDKIRESSSIDFVGRYAPHSLTHLSLSGLRTGEVEYAD